MKQSRSVLWLRCIALLVLFASFSSRFCDASDTWKVALNSPQLFVKYQVIDNGAPQSIVLIGENHASVKTQQQLADLLQALYAAHGIDAILVEGSYGPIDATSLRNSAGKFRGEKTADFWRGKLALGQLAGYEYVALTRDGVHVYGVENMDAKREYTVGSARRGISNGLQEEIDLHNHALALAQQAALPLSSSTTQAANVQSELDAYQQQIKMFAALVNTDGPQYAQVVGTYTDNIELLTALYNKLGPVLEAVRSRAPEATLAAAFKNAGYSSQQAVIDDLNRTKQAESALKASETEIKKLGASFTKQENKLLDQFFIVTNAIRTASGQPNPSLQSFLRNEHEEMQKQIANRDAAEAQYLTDRDRYMVSNTMSYLANHPEFGTVALIVGFAHLEGLTDRFAKQQVNLLAGKLSASQDEIEAWENRAWEERSHPAELIFVSNTGKRKEQSRLQDKAYAQNMTALLSHLQSVSPTSTTGIRVGDTKVFEIHSTTAGTKAIVVTSDTSQVRDNWGSYVVDTGVLPDGSGANYLLFDRSRAHSQTLKATTPQTLFASAYQTRTPEGSVTKIDLPSGPVTISAFKAHAPTSGDASPKRVVLAVEGDAKPLSTALGSGGNGNQPPWTDLIASFAEPPDRRPPSVLFTKNIRRAQLHLGSLENQQPVQIGNMASFDFGVEGNKAGSLDDLWFTPDRGDHARVLLISGENTQEFRKQLKSAADAHLLENKQIALATCFDPKETDGLREMLLQAGAVMVWTPENRISPDAARKLNDYMRKVDTVYGNQAPQGLDEYMRVALELWYKDSPKDPDLLPLLKASRWVELRMVAPGSVSDTVA